MGISLRVLEARFVRRQGAGYHIEPTIESADGISFVCPLCWLAFKPEAHGKDGPQIVRGVHSVLCWRPRVPAGIDPGPGRWEMQGTGISDVTLVAGSSSIHLLAGCGWHGYVQNGEATGGLEPGDIERARAYDRAVRQTIIDRETAMTGTSTSTDTSSATSDAPGATDLDLGATSDTAQQPGELTREPFDDTAAPVLTGSEGFAKTMDLRVAGHRLQQRWVSGHDGSSVWVEIEGQR